MFAVINQEVGKKVVKILSASAYNIFVATVASGTTRKFEVPKAEVMHSSLDFKDCLNFILEQDNAKRV
jgi:hypothetical protein